MQWNVLRYLLTVEVDDETVRQRHPTTTGLSSSGQAVGLYLDANCRCLRTEITAKYPRAQSPTGSYQRSKCWPAINCSKVSRAIAAGASSGTAKTELTLISHSTYVSSPDGVRGP
jgi:hypothetical protein